MLHPASLRRKQFSLGAFSHLFIISRMHRLLLETRNRSLSDWHELLPCAALVIKLLHETAPCALKLLESRAPLRRQERVKAPEHVLWNEGRGQQLFMSANAEIWAVTFLLGNFQLCSLKYYHYPALNELRHLSVSCDLLHSYIFVIFLYTLRDIPAVQLHLGARSSSPHAKLILLVFVRSNIYSAGEEGANFKQLATA